MTDMTCTYCGATRLEPGFLEDTGQSSQGNVRWVAGALERGLFGGARRVGRQRWLIKAFRCAHCAHLELFADEPK